MNSPDVKSVGGAQNGLLLFGYLILFLVAIPTFLLPEAPMPRSNYGKWKTADRSKVGARTAEAWNRLNSHAIAALSLAAATGSQKSGMLTEKRSAHSPHSQTTPYVSLTVMNPIV